jgi:hypothetical protein
MYFSKSIIIPNLTNRDSAALEMRKPTSQVTASATFWFLLQEMEIARFCSKQQHNVQDSFCENLAVALKVERGDTEKRTHHGDLRHRFSLWRKKSTLKILDWFLQVHCKIIQACNALSFSALILKSWVAKQDLRFQNEVWNIWQITTRLSVSYL